MTCTNTTEAPVPAEGMIYKACGNRRESVCPACSKVYQRDAYQLVRTGLVGGKGVPEAFATHPCLFVTLTTPGFGAVHSRPITRHTCENRKRCDCRPRPCHPGRRDQCPHGRSTVCFARHDRDDQALGQPLCLDCYDYPWQAVWNNQAGELWRRTSQAITRTVRRTAKRRGIDPATVKVGYGKVAEMQRRGVVHFHAVIRLDGADAFDPTAVLSPPHGIGVAGRLTRIDSRRCSPRSATPPTTCSTGWATSRAGAGSTDAADRLNGPNKREQPTSPSPLRAAPQDRGRHERIRTGPPCATRMRRGSRSGRGPSRRSLLTRFPDFGAGAGEAEPTPKAFEAEFSLDVAGETNCGLRQ